MNHDGPDIDDDDEGDPVAPWREGIARRLRQLSAADTADELVDLALAIGLFAGMAGANVAALAGERAGIIGMADAGDDQVEAAANALAEMARIAMQLKIDADQAEAEE